MKQSFRLNKKGIDIKNIHSQILQVGVKGTTELEDLDQLWITDKLPNNIQYLVYPKPGLHIYGRFRDKSRVDMENLLDLTLNYGFVPNPTFPDWISDATVELEKHCSQSTLKTFAAHLMVQDNNFSLFWLGSVEHCQHSFPQFPPFYPPDNLEALIAKQGYHAKLKFAVKRAPHTNFTVIHHVPRDFFYDPYELARINFGNTKVSVHGSVDLEVSVDAAAAKDHLLVAEMGKDTFYPRLEVPFHVRYQPPSEEKAYGHVYMPSPVFISSAGSTELDCPHPMIPSFFNISGCVNVYGDDLSTYFSVPLGNASHRQYIDFGTNIVVWVGVIAIFWNLWSVKLTRKSKKE
jgi:hypothetical protein